MNLIDKLISSADITVDEPGAMGSYHILCILLVTLTSLFLYWNFKNCTDKTFRRIIFSLWVVMFIFEIYKQIFFCLDKVDGAYVYNYNWDAFPFQLCSTPLYVLPLLAILRDGPARDFVASYTMSYALIGAIAVFLVPDTAFTTSGLLNVQTMVHHGIQFVTGLFAAAWYRKRITWKFYLKGWSVFVIMFTIAMMLNTVLHDYLIESGILSVEDKFSMFYLNPDQKFEIPGFEWFFDRITSHEFILLYFIGLPFASAIIMHLHWVVMNTKSTRVEILDYNRRKNDSKV